MSARDVNTEILTFRQGKRPRIIFHINEPNGLSTQRIDVSKMVPMLTDKDLEELLAQMNEEFTARKTGRKSVNTLAG